MTIRQNALAKDRISLYLTMTQSLHGVRCQIGNNTKAKTLLRLQEGGGVNMSISAEFGSGMYTGAVLIVTLWLVYQWGKSNG